MNLTLLSSRLRRREIAVARMLLRVTKGCNEWSVVQSGWLIAEQVDLVTTTVPIA